MGTVKWGRVLYWGTLGVLVVAALTWGLDRILPNTNSLVMKQCNSDAKQCSAPLSDINGVVTLSFENGIHAAAPMLLTFSLPDTLAGHVHAVQMTLQGKDHYMGVSTMDLIHKPSPNTWLARVLLPGSDVATPITWKLVVTVSEESGAKHVACFEFTVPSPQNVTKAAASFPVGRHG